VSITKTAVWPQAGDPLACEEPEGTAMAHDETRQTIVHNFARWAAASSARQGASVRGRTWYERIDLIDRKTIFATRCPSEEEFAQWHQREVKKLTRGRTGKVETIGWAAKILNMVMKVEVYLAGSGHPGLAKLIHPPIDNTVINAVIREYCKSGDERSREIRKFCSMGKPINSIKDYSQYDQVIKGLRIVADLRGCSLFEVESLFGG
jgi:hypothetical protein